MEPDQEASRPTQQEGGEPSPQPTVVEHHHYHYGNDGCKSWGCLALELIALVIFALIWMLGHPV